MSRTPNSRAPHRSYYKSSQNIVTPPSTVWSKGRNTQMRMMSSRSSESSVMKSQPRLTYGPGELLDQISCVNAPEGSLGSESDQFPDSFGTSSSNNSSFENDLASNSSTFMTLNRLVILMEEQSKRVDTVLKNQEEIKCEHDAICFELEELKKNCGSSVLKAGKGGNHRKRLVTRKLTDQVNAVYDSIEEKFQPDKSSASNENKVVIQKLIDEIQLAYSQENTDEEYPSSIIKQAVKRKYESERRLFNESQKGTDIKGERLKKAKYEQRKERAYDRRKSMIAKNEERFFDMISKDYMSEESDCTSDPEYIITHKHLWRSESMPMTFQTWFSELDQRYQRKQKKAKCIMPPKKRKIGQPAKSNPPAGAPSWAVNTEWKPDTEEIDPLSEFEKEEITEFTVD